MEGTMGNVDVADQGLPFLLPVNTVVPLTDEAPRCRRCAAVLVVAHLRCDDGGMVPIVRCPICRHEPVETRQSSVVGRQTSMPHSGVLEFAD